MAFTINIHKNEVTISVANKPILYGPLPVIKLLNIPATYNKYITTEVPLLVGNYFTPENDVVITYHPKIKSADIAIITSTSIIENEEQIPNKQQLYLLYTTLALHYKTVPVIVTTKDKS
jgi:hypothetical protein